MAVQQQNLQLKLDEAQLRYMEKLRKQQSSFETPIVNKLPTELEELRGLFPGYNTMTEEEKQEVDAMLIIQIMINTSTNEMLEAQANYQFEVGMQQWSAQIEEIDQEVSNGTYNVKISKLERQRLELLAQLYAFQSYYEIVGIEMDLRAAQYEIELANLGIKDSEKLYQYGLTTEKDVEQAKLLVVQHKQSEKKLQTQLIEKKEQLKLMLGIKRQDTIVIPKIDTLRLTNSYDNEVVVLSKQIDYIKAEESSNFARTRLEVAKVNNHLLADYLNTLLIVEVEKKDIIAKWLEQKIGLLASEQTSIKLGIDVLEDSYKVQASKVEDYKKLLTAGKISERELEVVSSELSRLKFNLDKIELEYLLWQEKKRVAVLGVLQ